MNLPVRYSFKRTSILKLILVTAIVFVGACLLAASPAHRSPAQIPTKPQFTAADYVGSWRAEFKDTTFAILKLRLDGKTLIGSLSTGDVSVDDDGNLRSATAETGKELPLIDPTVNAEKLLFHVKDGEDDDRWEFSLTDPTHGRLKFLPTPDAPKINPFAMTKDQPRP